MSVQLCTWACSSGSFSSTTALALFLLKLCVNVEKAQLEAVA